MQSRLQSCGIVHDVGKENVEPGAKTKRPLRPRAKKVATQDVNPTHCSQIPIAQSVCSLKRTRKQGGGLTEAPGVDTTPYTPRISRSKKVATAAGELMDLMLQTPMPESPGGNKFGPPPPNSTPAPQRECRLILYSPAFCIPCLHRWFVLAAILIAVDFCRWSMGSSIKANKGGEGEGGAIQAETAACMGAPTSGA